MDNLTPHIPQTEPAGFNPEAERAYRIVSNTGTHLFLTGKAGTGKTTFLKRLRRNSPKRMVVLAPTGIAAINAEGVTIHSFFQFPFAPYVPEANYSKEMFRLRANKLKLIRSLDLIVIDEISMVRADLLDHIDAMLRRIRRNSLPFGGVQLLMIGDLQQLAPVVKDEEWNLLKNYYDTPFFFGSRALQQTYYVTIELQHVYRQRDREFLDILNQIRTGKADMQTLKRLNDRYRPGFSPDPEEGYIRLVTHNRQAKEINDREMAALKGEDHFYYARIEGDFPESSYPTEQTLKLRKGAQVMFVKNDAMKGYFNGMTGEVVGLHSDYVMVRPHEHPDVEIKVEPQEWCNVKYALDKETREIKEQQEGSFSQIPLRAAWSITIHKSQGLTFRKAMIDAHSAFAHGQTYVALSRCTTMEGLILSSPLPPDAIICDRMVEDYSRRMTEASPGNDEVERMERSYYIGTLKSLFDFTELRQVLDAYLRLVEEFFYGLYPKYLDSLRTEKAAFIKNVLEVGPRFCRQVDALTANEERPSRSSILKERVSKACGYFHEQLERLRSLVSEQQDLSTGNVETDKRVGEKKKDLMEALRGKLSLVGYTGDEGFDLEKFLRKQAVLRIGDSDKPGKTAAGKSGRKGVERRDVDVDAGERSMEKHGHSSSSVRAEVPEDILHPVLFRALTDWRYQKAKAEKRPAYTILSQKALLGIANRCPDTIEKMRPIPYVGDKTIGNFGEELLDIVRSCKGRE